MVNKDVHRVPKNVLLFYLWNNSVKNKPIS